MSKRKAKFNEEYESKRMAKVEKELKTNGKIANKQGGFITMAKKLEKEQKLKQAVNFNYDKHPHVKPMNMETILEPVEINIDVELENNKNEKDVKVMRKPGAWNKNDTGVQFRAVEDSNFKKENKAKVLFENLKNKFKTTKNEKDVEEMRENLTLTKIKNFIKSKTNKFEVVIKETIAEEIKEEEQIIVDSCVEAQESIATNIVSMEEIKEVINNKELSTTAKIKRIAKAIKSNTIAQYRIYNLSMAIKFINFKVLLRVLGKKTSTKYNELKSKIVKTKVEEVVA